MLPDFGIGVLLAVFTALVSTPVVKRIAFKVGAVDLPDKRKVHKEPMPRLGGLAIYLAFMVGMLSFGTLDRDNLIIMTGATLIVAVGVLDDIYQLPAKVKLAGQIAAGAVPVLAGIRIEWIGGLLGGDYIYFEEFSFPLTIFWIVAFTNVVNLIDGLDGLAAGVGAIGSFTIAFLALQAGYADTAYIYGVLCAAIIGFLPFNFNPASIFMGDTGSMFIGYIVGAFSVDGVVKTAATVSLLVPAIAFGLPIMDTAFAIVRRYRNGVPIFKPDKGHIHHRLLALGLTQREAVLVMHGITLALALAAVFLARWSRGM